MQAYSPLGCFVEGRVLSLGLCDDLGRGMGVWGGREAHEGGDICIHLAESCCCAAETNTTYRAIILQLKKKERNWDPLGFNSPVIARSENGFMVKWKIGYR